MIEYKLSRSGFMKALFDATDILNDPDALRSRFAQDGYIYVRGIVPHTPLKELRKEIVEICEDCGWIKQGTNPMDAITWTPPKHEGEEEYFEVYDQIQRLESFHALAHRPELSGLMRTLLDESAFPHPLSIARLVFPDNEAWSTPPHQDYINNQGTTELYAVWIPLSDCPRALGPLSVLSGSHKLGVLPVEYAWGPGHRQTKPPAEYANGSWLGGDLQLGDVIIFHSMTIHQALPNKTDRLRLSVDYRYQAEKQAMTENCLVSHFDRQSWADIYRGWSSTDLQYYWKNKNVNFVPWDASLGNLPEEALKKALALKRLHTRQRSELAEKFAGDAKQ
ncbi:MAG: ectoine hydroxylase-related dioxygenase (phytanoyl-CoA dioxygenase family) [Halieaceae bacterium]|jgi:ectoine hydroxylase-related dioxygenase (phytanoyl-CoA dioxygenase family)